MKVDIQLSYTAFNAVKRLARHQSLSHEVIRFHLDRVPLSERLSFVMTLTDKGRKVLDEIHPKFLSVLLN